MSDDTETPTGAPGTPPAPPGSSSTTSPGTAAGAPASNGSPEATAPDGSSASNGSSPDAASSGSSSGTASGAANGGAGSSEASAASGVATAVLEPPSSGAATAKAARGGWRVTSLEVLCVLLVVAIVFQSWFSGLLDNDAIKTGSTIFVAVCVQALPFLVLGVLISGAIAAFVPGSLLNKLLPKNQAFAVPVAGVAGVALPTCECAAVPVSRRLIQQGVPASVALAFLLAAPAVNPIVLVATNVAFPNNPEMVAARLVGSLTTAVFMGWLWARFGKAGWIVEHALRRLPAPQGKDRWRMFFETARADLVDAGGFLVIGGLTAAALNVLIPREWVSTLGEQIVFGIIVMAVLAVLLALCSEADAFVAASISGMPLLPKLVFLVVGPAIDVKLFALQAGTFGKSFAVRFAPATFVVATLCAVGSGLIFLGGA